MELILKKEYTDILQNIYNKLIKCYALLIDENISLLNNNLIELNSYIEEYYDAVLANYVTDTWDVWLIDTYLRCNDISIIEEYIEKSIGSFYVFKNKYKYKTDLIIENKLLTQEELYNLSIITDYIKSKDL